MAGKRSARRGNRRAASGDVVAWKRNSQKLTSTWTDFQQPLGSICVYDGLDYCGAVVPQRGKWLAVNAEGRRVGTFDLRHRAEHALYQAGGPGGRS